MTFKILSLDGGGIRGVVSATILKEIETILEKKKGKKLHEYFDLIAGTSTGSILTAGIACQMNAQQLIDVYKNEGQRIFLKSVRQQRQTWRPSNWVRRLLGNYALYPHKQGKDGLANVLQEKLIDHTSRKCLKISDIKSPFLLIFSYDVLTRNTTWFENHHPNNQEKEWYDNVELWKICTASASAPTFFPPYELPYNHYQNLPHIDGGVAANNPELAAITHALGLKKINGEKPDLSDIALLSIGTGKTTHPYSYEEIKGWGLLGWVKNLPNIFLNPAADFQHVICREVLKYLSNDQQYLRLDFDLNEQFKGEWHKDRLRDKIKAPEKPYNEYIYLDKKEYKQISEDIDNSEICPVLIEAAQCYLKKGKVSYNNQKVEVISAIEQFIDSH